MLTYIDHFASAYIFSQYDILFFISKLKLAFNQNLVTYKYVINEIKETFAFFIISFSWVIRLSCVSPALELVPAPNVSISNYYIYNLFSLEIIYLVHLF